MRVCMVSTTFFWVPSSRMAWYTRSAAWFMARNADSGYRIMPAPASRSSSRVNSGVAPNSVMLASSGVSPSPSENAL